MTSKEYLISLVRSDIVGFKDNLFRAKLAQKNNPKWKSGNNESIQEVIDSYQAGLDIANKALAEVEGL